MPRAPRGRRPKQLVEARGGCLRLQEVVAEDTHHLVRGQKRAEQNVDEAAFLAFGAPARVLLAEGLVARQDQRQVGLADARKELDNLDVPQVHQGGEVVEPSTRAPLEVLVRTLLEGEALVVLVVDLHAAPAHAVAEVG